MSSTSISSARTQVRKATICQIINMQFGNEKRLQIIVSYRANTLSQHWIRLGRQKKIARHFVHITFRFCCRAGWQCQAECKHR